MKERRNIGSRPIQLEVSAGMAMVLTAAWADMFARLGSAFLERVEGVNLALLSFVFLVSALAAMVGVLAGMVLRMVLNLVRPAADRAWLLSPVFLAAPSALYQGSLMAAGSQTIAWSTVAIVASFFLAALLSSVISRRRLLLTASPLMFFLLFLASAWGHQLVAGRYPAMDAVPADEVANPGAPDLLLITLDTTRADHLGCYGYAEARTPNLDRLAGEGVLYERVYAPNSSTQPSHASILTGAQLAWHGIRVNGGAAMDRSIDTVAGKLAAAGYETRAAVASLVLDRRFGLNRGFTLYDDFVSQGFGPARITSRLLRRQLRSTLGFKLLLGLGIYDLFSGELARNAAAMATAGVELVQTAPAGRPLFLWVHFWDPHLPYDPPPGFVRPWTAEAGAPAEGYEYWFGNLSSLAEIHALYDAEIAYMDSELPRLLEAFRARGRPGVVVVTADHGEGLHEHGVGTHGADVYDVTLRVPLLIAGAGIPAGRRVDAAVASYDIAPTLLELAGCAPIPGIHGRSLAPFDASAPACEAERAFYHESKLKKMAWRENGMKLVLGEPQVELYRYWEDPAELENLEAGAADLVKRLGIALTTFRELFPKDRGGELPDQRELQDKLAELGYADDAE